jgi:hypothetical protein
VLQMILQTPLGEQAACKQKQKLLMITFEFGEVARHGCRTAMMIS